MDDLNAKHEEQFSKNFQQPKNLAKKSPLRLLAIDELMNGEEILPRNFVLVFIPNWHKEELRSVQGLYVKAIPVIGINGKCVFLNSGFQDSKLESYLEKQRRLQRG